MCPRLRGRGGPARPLGPGDRDQRVPGRGLSLRFADHDARSLAEALEERGEPLFERIHTRVLVNQQATRDGIRRSLGAFFDRAQEDDAAIIVSAVTGMVSGSTYFFLPHDATPANLASRGLAMGEFQAAIEEIHRRVDHLALILDTCHAGALKIGVGGASLADGVGDPEFFTLSSSRSSEVSLEYGADKLDRQPHRLPGTDGKGHGAFTYALLRGLLLEEAAARARTSARSPSSTSSATPGKQVTKITGNRQRPYLIGSGSDFALARVSPPPAPDARRAAKSAIRQGLAHEAAGDLDRAAAEFDRAATADPATSSPSSSATGSGAADGWRRTPGPSRPSWPPRRP